jgi:hypothetical protein
MTEGVIGGEMYDIVHVNPVSPHLINGGYKRSAFEYFEFFVQISHHKFMISITVQIGKFNIFFDSIKSM